MSCVATTDFFNKIDPKRTFAGSLLPHLRGCKFSQYDGSVGA
jgi:hypothetical protein